MMDYARDGLEVLGEHFARFKFDPEAERSKGRRSKGAETHLPRK